MENKTDKKKFNDHLTTNRNSLLLLLPLLLLLLLLLLLPLKLLLFMRIELMESLLPQLLLGQLCRCSSFVVDAFAVVVISAIAAVAALVVVAAAAATAPAAPGCCSLLLPLMQLLPRNRRGFEINRKWTW